MKYTLFGESHGAGIGLVLEGVPSGMPLDMPFLMQQLARRAPGNSAVATARREADTPNILSGVLEQDGAMITTGAPLCVFIENSNTRSKDYEALRTVPRPSHADYPASVRYQGFQDVRGGGHFSGRLTAPLVFAGALAQQWLKSKGIAVGAHISQVGHTKDSSFNYVNPSLTDFAQVRTKEFPVLSDARGAQMMDEILAAKAEEDSIGGSITCCITGVPVGCGGPDYADTVEGMFARALFAIPAVRGVVFGDGIELASMRGSEGNDALRYVNGKVVTTTNHSGGVNGGITNGMPLIFTVYFRPTPSIGKPQESVNLLRGENETLTLQGRHDPCIVPRAVPVVEAAAALATMELLEGGCVSWTN